MPVRSLSIFAMLMFRRNEVDAAFSRYIEAFIRHLMRGNTAGHAKNTMMPAAFDDE